MIADDYSEVENNYGLDSFNLKPFKIKPFKWSLIWRKFHALVLEYVFRHVF